MVLKVILLLPCVLYAALPAGGAKASEVIGVPFTSDRWDVISGAKFSQKEGFQDGILTLSKGRVTLKAMTFGDGTIEYDVKPTGGFAGITFHRRDADTS